jgi:hypothetical protein
VLAQAAFGGLEQGWAQLSVVVGPLGGVGHGQTLSQRCCR